MPFIKTPGIFESRSRKLIESAQINGLRHTLVSPSHDYYRGEWKNSLKDGWGIYLSRSGIRYDGDFIKNFREGVGILAERKPNKIFRLMYRGDWKKGYKNGYGAMHYPDGGYCLGYWKNGKRHGYARMWYGDGGFYDGDWCKGLKQGLGLFVYPNGNRYEGEWWNDMKHGRARYYHLDSGQMQEGIWREDYCVYSILIDIPYRQTAIYPTSYPIVPIEVIDIDNICNAQEQKALDGKTEPCLDFNLPDVSAESGSSIS